MSSRTGYIGGYFDPDLKEKFLQEAERKGINQTDLLNSILNNYFGLGVTYSPLDEEEFEGHISNDLEEWDKIGELSRRKLNCLILEAHHEAYSDESIHIPQFLERLGDSLIQESDNDVDYHCEDEDNYYELMPDDIANEVTTIIARAVREFGGSTPTKEQLFTLAGKFLNQRANTLYVDARRLTIKFSRDEWYYIDKLLAEINEEENKDFNHLSDYLRYKLGNELEYAGKGFFVPKDRGMMEMGIRLKQNAEE